MLFKLLRFVTVTLSLGQALAEVKMKGVNIAGFDFGCIIDGSCDGRNTTPPFLSPGKWVLPRIPKSSYYSDGIGQMQHFSSAYGLNVYRLPVGWPFLVNWTLGGTLDVNAFGLFDELVQGCLQTGSYCLIDVHSYARYEGWKKVVGQGGPTNEEFASLWRQLATKYKADTKVIFGLANEPHDLDMDIWADTIQYTVNAIRKAGATTHMIFLPGTKYSNALDFDKLSAPALSKVHNPDGSNDNLIYEVHRYFAAKNGVDSAECIADHIDDAFKPLAEYLRAHKRKAMVAEVGGGPRSASCQKYVCDALAYLNANSDVYLGYAAWAAGAFGPNYGFTVTPKGTRKTGWVDQPLLTKCLAKNFGTGP